MTISVPDFVKTATAEQLEGAEHSPARSFADPASRSFYLGTKAATWLSASRLPETAHDKTAAEQLCSRIRKAAQVHGITTMVEELLSASGTVKTAGEAPTCYALTVDSPTGTQQHYRIDSAAEIQKAAWYLMEHRNSFTGAQQQQFAQAVLDRADTLSVALPAASESRLRKVAGQGECLIQDVLDAVRARVLLADTQYVEPLQKIAAAVTVRLPHELRLELAAALVDLDQQSGLARRYGQDLRPPEDHLFHISKTAIETALANYVALTNGAILEKSELRKVSTEQVRSVLGDEVADSVSDLFGVDVQKLATLLPTLSRAEARRFIAATA